MSRHVLSRRTLLEGAVLAAVLPHVRRRGVVASGIEPATPTSATSMLIAASQVDGLLSELITELAYIDHAGRVTGTVAVDGYLTVVPTMRQGTVLGGGMSATAVINAPPGGPPSNHVAVDAWPALPDPRTAGRRNGQHADWALFTDTTFAEIYLVSLQTGEASDITAVASDADQGLHAAIGEFSADGHWLGVWTGDHGWLVDTTDLTSARALVGDDPQWYSGALAMSDDGSWVGYTSYTPGTGQAKVWIESVPDGEPAIVVEGTPWSAVTAIPGDDASFVLSHDGAVGIRNVAAPGSGEAIGEIGVEAGEPVSWSAAGDRAVMSSRQGPDQPDEWHIVDLVNGSVTTLDALRGLRHLGPSAFGTTPEWLMFGPQLESAGERSESGPLVSIHVASGETRQHVDDIRIDNEARWHSSADGRTWLVSTGDDVVAVPVEGGGATTLSSLLPTGTATTGRCAIAPDGTRFVIGVTDTGASAESAGMVFGGIDPVALDDRKPMVGIPLIWPA